jgi:pimeloyl-ACP methyl ester carboxylesterase
MDDGRRFGKVAKILARRFRVVRLQRRQYRVDLKTDPKLGVPCNTVAQEVDDILAVVRAVGGPVVIYGHSDGGVVALEALVASPSSFAGAVIYEPAAVIGPPLAGEGGEVLKQARAELVAGKPGKALALFLRDTIKLTPFLARLSGIICALIPRYRRLIPCQLDACEALDQLGVRLDAYSRITVPTVLLGGDLTQRATTGNLKKNPAHIGERLVAAARAIPSAEQVIMHGQGHGADLTAPKKVARVIETVADKVFG